MSLILKKGDPIDKSHFTEQKDVEITGTLERKVECYDFQCYIRWLEWFLMVGQSLVSVIVNWREEAHILSFHCPKNWTLLSYQRKQISSYYVQNRFQGEFSNILFTEKDRVMLTDLLKKDWPFEKVGFLYCNDKIVNLVFVLIECLIDPQEGYTKMTTSDLENK